MFPSQLCKVTESLIRLLAHMARSFRESCLHFRGTLRTLFTEPHKSFYNRTSIVSCRAAENEFISWLVSDFMLSAALWMLPEISRTETLIAISSTLSCMKSNYFVMFPLTSDDLTPAADQTGKLFVGDAVLQVGTAVRDSRSIRVSAKSGNLLRDKFSPLGCNLTLVKRQDCCCLEHMILIERVF